MEPCQKIKVLIADDERLVRMGLKQTIFWEQYNMEVVSDVPNGAAAWEEIEKCKPELVITDITMPVMDGIELTKRIKDAYPATKIIFLSCHRDFEYAQQAIQYGVSGYILKTAMTDDEEINQHLRTVQKEIEKQNLAALPGADEPEHFQRDRQIRLWLDGLKSIEDMTCTFDSIFREEKNSLHVLRVEYLPETAEAAVEFFSAFNKKYPHEKIDIIRYHQELFFLLCPDTSIEHLLQFLIEEKLRINAVNWVKKRSSAGLNQILHTIEILFKEWELQSVYGEEKAISDPIMKSLIFIDRNLDQPITANELSKTIGFSRSHFSTVFKKEVGTSYIAYLQERRLNKAKILLSSTDWKLNEIALKIGMEDYKHFCKWFKRNTNMTPTQYRIKQKYTN